MPVSVTARCRSFPIQLFGSAGSLLTAAAPSEPTATHKVGVAHAMPLMAPIGSTTRTDASTSLGADHVSGPLA
jgi:hypothetical protein